MKHTLLFGAITSIFAINVAMADTVVTSKTYVDGRDALKVDIAQGTGDNNANVGKTLVVNSSGNLELGTPAAGNYVEDSITDGVTDKAPSENAVHDALENKQDMITTAEVDMNGYDLPALVSYDTTNGLTGNRIGIFDYETVRDDEGDLSFYSYEQGGYGAEMDNYVPTVRSVANSLAGIIDNIPSAFSWNSNDATAVNNYSISFTGTTGDWPSDHQYYDVNGNSLAQGLALKQNKIDAINNNILANGDQVGAVLAPTGTAGVLSQIALFNPDGDMGSWPSPSDNTPNATLLRNSIPTVGAFGEMIGIVRNAQTKIPARATKIESTDSTYAPSVVTNGTTDGSVGQMAILTSARVVGDDGADGGEFADYTNADNLIPTAAAVGTELSYKQNILGGRPEYDGKVVTATGTSGTVTYTAIDSTPTSASTNLVTSGGVYTAINAKQAKKTCAGWPDGAEHTDANCWLWNMPD